MNVKDLVGCLETQNPNSDPTELARLCLLLLNTAENTESLRDEEQLKTAAQAASMRLQFVTDQHAAMTQELEALAASDPKKFCPDQIWILVRAIKVQSQLLQMYVGEAAIDV